MSNNKTFKGRIQLKHDTSTNWSTASNNGFIPLDGEIIIYDDLNRIKIGDGETLVNDLPFINSQSDWNQTDSTEDDFIKNKPNLDNMIELNKSIITLPDRLAWVNLTYGNNKFVIYARSSNLMAESLDGMKWERRQSSHYNFKKIIYSDNKFIAIKSSSIFYSQDGINWIESIPSQSGLNLMSVCHGNNKTVSVSYNSKISICSIDGVNWTQGELPYTAAWCDICYGNNLYIAISYDGHIAYSSDGINWTGVKMSGMDNLWRKIAYGNGVYVITTYNSSIGVYSIDGINWNQTYSFKSGRWDRISYIKDRFIIMQNSADQTRYIYSTDGINWNYQSCPLAKIVGLAYGNDRIFILSEDETDQPIYWSKDGVEWTQESKVLIQANNDVSEDTASVIKPYLGLADFATKDSVESKASVQLNIWGADD